MSESRLRLHFGALCPSLSEQLKEQEIPYDKEQMKIVDDHAVCLDKLRIHGIITDSECDKARKRLMGKIHKMIVASKKEKDHAKDRNVRAGV